MSMTVKTAEKQLDMMIRNAVAAATAAGELPEGDLPAYVIEVPADRTHGDLATNVAMVSAKAFRAAPRKIADAFLRRAGIERIRRVRKNRRKGVLLHEAIQRIGIRLVKGLH